MAGLGKTLLLPPIHVVDTNDYGFRLVYKMLLASITNASQRGLHPLGINELINASMHSYELFSFSINVVQAPTSNGKHFIYIWLYIIHTEQCVNWDITVVGQLLPAFTKCGATIVVFKPQS